MFVSIVASAAILTSDLAPTSVMAAIILLTTSSAPTPGGSRKKPNMPTVGGGDFPCLVRIDSDSHGGAWFKWGVRMGE